METGGGLHPFRVGCVRALNTAPLCRGIENDLVFAAPAELARMLQQGELDAALVSVVEPLWHDDYDILDGVAVASLGEVKSVFLAHRRPLEEIETVYYDPGSLTSVTLLRVLLAERGLQPRFQALEDLTAAAELDNVMLIGDAALDFLFAPHDHQIFDLGYAWYELTRLPFVYAVWALRRAVDHAPLRRILRETRDFGMETLDHIVRERTEYTADFRRDYLGWHIHYHLGDDEKRGIARFMELMEKHGLGPVHPPRYVW
ncbi:menaquinone biosynthetic enzyme MqnA/MqnD family protein [Limisphaera sp. 4302-co]|uniref:menaquinone biosynthetic enzyme MqnA/MqnD family protein n=1 Tax=Limisphaera sp. 4302-co TaxID=3400417 RepID=UPI003C1EBF99